MYAYAGGDPVNGSDPTGLIHSRKEPDKSMKDRDPGRCSRLRGVDNCAFAAGGASGLDGIGQRGGGGRNSSGGGNRGRGTNNTVSGGSTGPQSGFTGGTSSAVFNGDTIVVTATRSFSYWIFQSGLIIFSQAGGDPCTTSAQRCEAEAHVVVLQAQGGRPSIQESVRLASANPITVAQGLVGLEELKSKLTRRELRDRRIPFDLAEIYITRGPANGGYGPRSRSFRGLGLSTTRVDVVIWVGVNFQT
jgi:hypothetical protein